MRPAYFNIARIEPPHERGFYRARRCEAECGPQTTRYRHAARGTKCEWRAWYVINGADYCIRHAQALALQFVLAERGVSQANTSEVKR